jgi:hypothetical protein
MTEIGQKYLTAILESSRRSPLTQEHVYRLWRCAVKDDEKLIDTVIEKVYDEMITFDPERADFVMQLMIDRDEVAGHRFRTLLQDMRCRKRAPRSSTSDKGKLIKAAMPRYFFTIRSPDRGDRDEQGTLFPDDAAALDYACRIIRELKASGEYDDPGLVVEVRNEMRQMVLSIPFLAACA